MLIDLLIGLATMLVCLILQISLLLSVQHYFRRHAPVTPNPGTASVLPLASAITSMLVAGIMAQMAIWAALFLFLGEFGDFPSAFYHSAVNFTTLGYGDLVMSERHRLLGPLEAANGILMIGLSTSALGHAMRAAVGRPPH